MIRSNTYKQTKLGEGGTSSKQTPGVFPVYLKLRGCGYLKFPIVSNIEVSSNLKELDLVLLKFNQVYQEHICARDWLKCQLALAEGFTNAVRHAHKNLPQERAIFIQIILNPNAIEIRIWDRGKAFDLKKRVRKITAEKQQLDGSGRGIEIMSKIADRLEYNRIDKTRNCLLIVKNVRLTSKKKNY